MRDRIRIVRADPSDPVQGAQLAALEAECFEQAPKDLFVGGFWWLAYDSAGPVGYCGMRRSYQWLNVGYFHRAGVAERARGHGLQKRMIRVRLALAKKLGYCTVITDTTRNPPSANSLIGCGFRMYQPARPWSYRGACYWKREIK